MFYLFLVLIGLLALGAYATLVMHLVPGAAEERLGLLEPLPPDLGVWKVDETSPEGAAAKARGLVRQVRTCRLSSSGWFESERLVHQARYRDGATDAIVSVEPERLSKRRRVRRT
jgi:hypothetical protein